MTGEATLLLAMTVTCAALSTAAFGEAELGGVWVLDTVQDRGGTSRDPRWTFMLTFEGDHVFSATSTDFVEKHLAGPKGRKVEAVQRDIRFLGTYRLVGDRLVLTPRPRLTGAALEVATINFGPAAADGSLSPTCTREAGLVLANPATGRRLSFQRHKR